MIYVCGPTPKELKFTYYPDNTHYVSRETFEQILAWVNQTPIPKHIKLSLLKPSDWTEFMVFQQVLEQIVSKEMSGDIEYNIQLGYYPYARDDRFTYNEKEYRMNLCNITHTFLEYFTKQSKSVSIRRIFIVDPHSSIFENSSDLLTFRYPEFGEDLHKHEVIVPDAGALVRSRQYGHSMAEYHELNKTRTREGVSHIFPDNLADVTGRKFVIYDDICDGGATFISIAQHLKSKGAEEVVLCVAHGLFSKGIDHLLDNGIDEVRYANTLHQDPIQPMCRVFTVNRKERGKDNEA